ncbi:DEAD/DEAH box helicase [Sulfurimonas xiamenensis]|jgi:ATP-dependent RNA helicase RhlE|uniref:DEAD-box ATP-dependent RNA helicase RhpA n=1 Tax=Sulfurimonas xiamenensis TaxID=2590021 RepID=A0AAJ4DLX2_9BACT|nr:DEAD/DEAH box helicase [Sulfurimonas xiamenensis]QFR42411.1 DEAD/DEAH box helicase [Sulfurimonas xiamenensis]
MSFNTLGLSAPILKAIKEQGYSEPTPIQKEAIPVILNGRDILAGAQTGTGKTAGFTLPLLELLNKTKPIKTKQKIRALILTPTRELAAQVGESVEVYGKYLPFKSAVIFGGVKINPQLIKLKKGVDIVVATPGRLLDHISQKNIDLRDVEFLILDEADRMLDMGFINDIKKILAILPKQKQTLLFSATYSDEIKKLSDKLLKTPALIEVARRNTTGQAIKQSVYPVDQVRKRELLTHLIKEGKWKQVLVFTRTKHGANRLSGQLEKDGISAVAIHGNKSQNARTKALADFKKGEVRVLVATDIAARGIDIDQLPHVINYELPNVSEDYVHRIGRTGRAGNEGEAISLVCIDEHEYLASIEKLIKNDIQKVWLKDFKPDPSIKAQPINKGNTRNSSARSRSNNKPAQKPSGRKNRNSI